MYVDVNGPQFSLKQQHEYIHLFLFSLHHFADISSEEIFHHIDIIYFHIPGV